MRVLCLSHAWPSTSSDSRGIFVERQVASLKRLGVDVDVRVVGGGSGSPWVQSVIRLRHELACGDYDLVHAQYGGRTALAAVAASKRPVVISFCGSDLNGLGTGTRLERAYTGAGVVCSQISAPLATALIVKSEALAGRLWQRPDRRRCHVVPNGVDLELFRPIDRREARMRLGWPPDRPVVLASGQSDGPVKRLDIAAAAVELARKKVPELTLELLRAVPPKDVPWYLNAADVVILSSQHEGSPNIVKEALACNRAVVAVDVGDVRRWIGDAPGCWLCERTPARLAEALTKAVAAGGRSEGRRVISEISLPNVAARILKVYEEAVRQPRLH
jgi:glycosyltransferase involved in cell wall biosynthesis